MVVAEVGAGSAGRCLSWAAVISLPWIAGACTTTVVMADLEGSSPDQPHSTILYTGVRDTTRRFPDYSVVGRNILEGPRR